jgi:hypothetical protein
LTQQRLIRQDSAFYRPFVPELSQGDIFAELLVYRADAAAIEVKRQMLANSQEAWIPMPDALHVVVPAVRLPCIVISHDCIIDKLFNAAASGQAIQDLSAEEYRRRSSKTDVLVAPIREVPNSWVDEKMLQVAGGEVIHQFLLPPSDDWTWAGGYVDLRWFVTYRHSDLVNVQRLMWLAEDQIARLQAQLSRFHSGRELEPSNGPTDTEPLETQPD